MQRMLISVDRDESRAAVVENGRLTHLEIEPVSADSVKGNIYRAVVARVEPSLQSAFVDFGRAKQGFLPVGEIHRHLRKESHDKRTPIQDIIKSGQELLVQVVRDEIGNKGATLSTYVSLPGRYLVLMPQSDKSGVSRKLSDAARQRVKELTESMNVPEGFGIIVRTSGEAATKMQLTRDLVYLNRLWKHIEKECQSGKGAAPMYIERSLPIRFVRDYFTKDIDELVIDDETTANEIGAYLKLLMPRTLKAVERYSGAMPLFARYAILAQVESVFARQVPLEGGGSIVIDQTEALVAIDVNSGRVKGKDIEETARATNVEAAREIARQLVLRDLGGLVVCDFIDMRDRKAVREVETTLKSAMKRDKARHKLGRISEFGLLELSRQRLKAAVHRSAFETCEHCSGTGKYRTVESLTSSIIRRIYELITQRPVRHVIAMVPPDAANFLLNQRRGELSAVENEYGIGIEIVPMEGMTPANVMLEHFEEVPARGGTERLLEHRLKRVTQHIDMVRNRVMKREDYDIERKIRQSKAAAMVDWNEVYKDVEEQTANVTEEPTPAARDRATRINGRGADTSAAAPAPAPARTPAPAPVAVTVDDYPDLPAPKGFTGWIKSLFGMGAPAPIPAPRVAVQAPPSLPPVTPTPAAAAAGAPATSEGEEDESGGRRRRERGGRRRDGEDRGNRRSRGGRGRDRDGRDRDGSDRDGSARDGSARDGSANDAQTAKDANSERPDNNGEKAEKSERKRAERDDDARGDEDGEDRPKRRRRRRRRRRRDSDTSIEQSDGQAASGNGDSGDGSTRETRDAGESGSNGRGGNARTSQDETDGEPEGRRRRPRRSREPRADQDAAGATDAAESVEEIAAAGDADAASTRVNDAVGNDAVGNDAVGNDAVGNDAVGNDAVGNDAVASDAAGSDAATTEEAPVEQLADVTSLARQEIERLRLAAGAAPLSETAASADDEAGVEGAADADGAEAATDVEAAGVDAEAVDAEAVDEGAEAEAAEGAAADAAAAADTAAASTDSSDATEGAGTPPALPRTPFVVDLRSGSGT